MLAAAIDKGADPETAAAAALAVAHQVSVDGAAGARSRAVPGLADAADMDLFQERPPPPPRACAVCGKQGGSGELRRCTGCDRVWYCGQGCQRASWKGGHREECAVWRAERERRRGARAAAGRR
ncbi:MAG: hypothetical protein J3K34DRAFT_419410 [Monoraphidium minutum]|nr:MAG: hypothetical protein J3K34DRAFT_419410 [Monoraphidium minutum]